VLALGKKVIFNALLRLSVVELEINVSRFQQTLTQICISTLIETRFVDSSLYSYTAFIIYPQKLSQQVTPDELSKK